MKSAFYLLLACAAAGNAGAATLFSQSFDAGGPVSAYVDASNPDSGQWNAIGSTGAAKTWSIDSGRLRLDSTGANVAYASRTTDFTMPASTVAVSFGIDFISSSGSSTSAFQFLLGSGFDTTNTLPAASTVHSKFGLNFGAADTFTVRDVSGGVNGTGSFAPGFHQILFVANNSGGSMSYLAPDGSTEWLANDTWDLWVGTSRQLDDRPATSSGIDITDFKFGSNVNASFSLGLDDIQIQSLPEPGVAVLSGISLLGLLLRRRAGSR